MIIKNLYLKNYKKFEHSNISLFKWNIESPIQIIIGSNGSGKSSLLQQILPNVPTKSLFKKKGYKYLKILHNNNIYELFSDFSQSSKCHSFKINNEEYNKNNSSELQHELIKKHFNLSSLLLSIISCNLKWTNITPSIRKKYLYQLNPIDLSNIINLHKSVKKNLTKYKNNLSHLNERKQYLSQQLLSKKEYNIIQQKYNKYTKIKLDINNFKIYLHSLINQLSNKNIDTHSIVNLDNEEIDNLITNISYYIINIPNYFTNNLNNLLNNKESKLYNLKDKLSLLENYINETNSEIDKYKNTLNHLSNQSKIQSLKYSIQEYQKEIDNIKTNLINSIISKNTIDFNYIQSLILISYNYLKNNESNYINKIETYVENIQSIISSNPNIGSKISSNKINKIDKIYSKLTYINNKINHYKEKYNYLEKESNNISSQLKKLKSLSIPNTCISSKINSKCSLYLNYNNDIKNYTSKLNNITKELSTIKNILSKYYKIHNNLSNIYSIYNEINSIYNNLINYLKSNIEIIKLFNIFFPDIKISDLVLSSYSKNFIIYIKKCISYIKDIYKYYQLNEKIKEYNKELNSYKTSNQESINLIKKLYKDKINLLYIYQHQYKSISNKVSKLNNEINNIKNIQKYIDKLTKYHHQLDNNIEILKIINTKKYYKILIDIIDEYLIELEQKISELNEKIKQQEYIQNRLNEEVLNIIKNIKNDYKITEKIEYISLDLINYYTKEFIYQWINISNSLLSKLVTYEIKLDYEYLHNTDIYKFDFKFPLSVSSLKLSDISECSSGQQDMINLCMNISMMILLKLKDYPLLIDEIDRTFDETHKTNLLNFLNELLYNNIISQLFIVNHHAAFYEGFSGNIIVLNKDNISCPEIYNTNVTIK